MLGPDAVRLADARGPLKHRVGELDSQATAQGAEHALGVAEHFGRVDDWGCLASEFAAEVEEAAAAAAAADFFP